MLFFFTLPLFAAEYQFRYEKKGQFYQATLASFNPGLYDLSYKAFTSSGQVEDAYVLTAAAIAQRPNNLLWRERMTKVARWTGRDDEALEQLLYLVDKTDKLAFIDQTIELAEQIGDASIVATMLEKKAQQQPLLPHENLHLAKSHESLGDPEKAITFLEKRWQQTKKLSFLKEIANIYARMGAYELEVQVLKRLGKYEVKPVEVSVREAEAYIAMNQLDNAYAVLHSVRRQAPKRHELFWRTYANVAWLLQKKEQAAYAYALLEQYKKITDLGLRRYIEIIGEHDAYRATKLCVLGWQQFKSPVYLLWFVSYAFRMDDWHEFNQLHQKFGKLARDQLFNLPGFHQIQIQMYLKNKQYTKAQAAYLAALAELPEADGLKLAYLWFIIDRQNKHELRRRLIEWHEYRRKNEDFSLAFAQGYRLLGFDLEALQLLHERLSKNWQNIPYLVNYLDMLTALRSSDGPASRFERELRRYIWQLLQAKAKTGFQDSVFKTNYAKIARLEQPGSATRDIMLLLAQMPEDLDASNAYMAWALARGYYDAAKRMQEKARAHKQVIAPWIQLTLALHDRHADKMAHLLRQELPNLPHRDRVVAASRIGEHGLAEDLAYRGLRENPDNQKTYALFRQTMLPRADYWRLYPEDVHTGLLKWRSWPLKARYFITPSLALMPSLTIRQQETRDADFLTNVPRHDVKLSMTLHEVLNRGFVEWTAGYRNAMRALLTGGVRWFHRLSDKWSMQITGQYHADANESDYMTVGAMQNNFGLQFFNYITVRDELLLSAAQHFFYGQDGESVSNGQTWRMAYTHRLWLAYPNYFVRAFGSVNRFSNKVDVTGSLRDLLVVDDVTPTGEAVLPASFVQYGLALGVGERYREEYTHEWKPFAIASVFRNNTSSKLGTQFDAGFAGSVFGRDHLALFASHSTGVTGDANTRFVLGLGYQYYF